MICGDRAVRRGENKGAHLDANTGTPDLSGSNTRRVHTCRMNPAFHADAASCIGGSARVRPKHGVCLR